jgi:RNA polymerase sigma-70 factor (ECF subfamily)
MSTITESPSSNRKSIHTPEMRMAAADEQLLIEHAREGSQSAYRALVERHIRDAYHLAIGFVHDHDAAEDVVQEAFIRAHASLPSFRGDARFKTWLSRIVINIALSQMRRDRRRAEWERPLVPSSAIVHPGPSFPDDTKDHLERALHELPTLQRAVLILRHIDGLSTREVSTILRCSEGTVKTHLFRGMKKMRQKLRHLRVGE